MLRDLYILRIAPDYSLMIHVQGDNTTVMNETIGVCPVQIMRDMDRKCGYKFDEVRTYQLSTGTHREFQWSRKS